MKTAYGWNKKNTEYIGKINCRVDPLETEIAHKKEIKLALEQDRKPVLKNVYTLPANASWKAPSLKKGHTARRDLKDLKKGFWYNTLDERGTQYWMPGESNPRTITKLGEEKPEGWLEQEDPEVTARKEYAIRKEGRREALEACEIEFKPASASKALLFHADEYSLDRMFYASLDEVEERDWATKDGKKVLVTIGEIKEMLKLVAVEQGKVWSSYTSNLQK